MYSDELYIIDIGHICCYRAPWEPGQVAMAVVVVIV